MRRLLDWLKMACNRFGKAFDKLGRIERDRQVNLDLRAEKIVQEQEELRRRLKALEGEREERKLAALEGIGDLLILISNHLENISAHLLRKR